VTEKRFELQINENGQGDIIDWVESKEKNAICIYNDLGVLPYSSAKALCELLNQLYDENEQLKKVLGSILIEVSREISNTNYVGEIKVFINPNSFELISEVLNKYGALKDWYE